MPGKARLDLPATPDSPRSARGFVTEKLEAWGYRTLTADAALLTSELVANALRHATEPYAIEVEDLLDGVLVTVEDSDREMPFPRHPGPLSESGRGLAIVDSVAASWGADADSANGKLVWFKLTDPRR